MPVWEVTLHKDELVERIVAEELDVMGPGLLLFKRFEVSQTLSDGTKIWRMIPIRMIAYGLYASVALVEDRELETVTT